MKANRIFLPFIIFLTSTFSIAYAESAPFLKDTVILKEVVVVSTAKTEVNRNQIPFTVSVVDKEILDASTETGVLSILSEQVPGLFVTQKGVTGFGVSTGSAGTVNIHGVGGGNKVLMLLDGQPMWAGIFGHSIADAYVASDAEKVEVIRGPGSLLYGSNALGGVINVITRKAGVDGIHGRARAMLGSYNTQKYLGSAGYKKDKLNIYASVNHDRTDGQRDNSEFYITNAYIKANYEFSKNWDASADAIIADFKTVNPGAVTQPMFDNWAKALRTTYSVALNNRFKNMNGSVQVFYNNGKHKINDGYNSNSQPRTYLFRSDDYNAGIALFESFRLIEGNLLTVGIDAKQWGGRAWNDSINGRVGKIIDKKVNELAGYAVVQQTIFDKLTLNAGIRLENNENYGNEWIPQAGIAYNPTKQSTFKLSASKGFRSPNIRELYMFMPANPDLKPERMSNYDFSYLQSLLGNRLHLELTLFFAQGENLISTTMIDGKPLNVNTGKFINKGFDLGLIYHILPDLKFSGNYSFLDSDIKITASPKHKAFASLGWNYGKWTFTPNYQYIAGLYLADNVPATENYSLLNCNVSYKIIPTLTVFLNGENLTDTSYETYTGFPMPGTVVMGGIDWKF
ncbi:MAG: TonB-dependent receptor [Dysgonamonadaceae bacterium]|jgi:iron complex outermembrane receptor protein|nr:TonB-dependent receptor [Dysgonamonadaceae bacterium]